MPLSPGSSVGHYQILGSLGAGGMGEVYRARDTKLGREVAVKILPDEVRFDEERRARFAREARSLAALNHPNIAQVYGFEDGEPISALIMELVEGDDLSARIRRGPVPYDEAIAIARQIGEALQAAHDRGIIHRDLKPGNIKVRDDGAVKVLDFGLAKALDPESGIGEPPRDVSHSPTITTPAMTLKGVILGTAAYMAPEQAKGRAVDKRADIWAFGCVLYEMLTGRKAFAGEDVSDTLASILKSDPDWNGVPPQVTRLLRKCLEKDPRKRLHDIGDAWDLLDDAARPAAGASHRLQWLPWSLAALLAISLIGMVSMRLMTPPPVAPSSMRFHIEPPGKSTFDIYVALSPDGKRLAFTAVNADRVSTIWVRDLGQLEARQLPGTEGAWSPFWSPDGRFIAFGIDRSLKKIDLAGGPAQTIVEVTGAPIGLGAWNRDGTIVFGARSSAPMRRVAAAGGAVENVTTLVGDHQETTHSFPIFLPDGRRFLYWRGAARREFTGVYLGSLDKSADQQDERMIAGATFGPVGLVNGPEGYRLLIYRDGAVIALPFDVERAEVTGDGITIAENVGRSGSFGFFSAHETILAYRTGVATQLGTERLTWIDRKGAAVGVVGDPLPVSRTTYALAISPTGQQAAVMLFPTTPNTDLWLIEFARGIATRATFNEAADIAPVWSPDGSRVAFRTGTPTSYDIVSKDLNSTADEAPMTTPAMRGVPSDWSKDGRFLLFSRGGGVAATDLMAFDTKTKVITPILATTFDETDAQLSPDARVLAYSSNESGTVETYLRPFVVSSDGKPSLGPKWRVSTAGGSVPRWRGDGKELFFRGPGGEMMAADVVLQGGAAQTGLPRKLFTLAAAAAWDVMPDGQRFLMSLPANPNAGSIAPPDPITIVLNWQSGLIK